MTQKSSVSDSSGTSRRRSTGCGHVCGFSNKTLERFFRRMHKNSQRTEFIPLNGIGEKNFRQISVGLQGSDLT